MPRRLLFTSQLPMRQVAKEFIDIVGGISSSLTLEADTDLLLVFESEDASGTTDSMQYDNVAMTQVTGAAATEGLTNNTVWYMLAANLPAAGTWDLDSDQSGHVYVVQLSGAKQEAPQDSDGVNNINTQVLTSKTLTVASADSLIYALGGTGAGNTFVDVSGQTLELLEFNVGNSSALYSKAASSNTDISTDSDGTPARHVLSAVVIAPWTSAPVITVGPTVSLVTRTTCRIQTTATD